jgi:DNA polymerase III sliding clamp (beta) subunit (PCNA family)
MTAEATETETGVSELVSIESAQGVDQLREAIQAVALATDSSSHAMLASVCLEVEDGQLVLVGTDRFRLHVARVQVEPNANLTPTPVNAKELAAWAKTAKGACTLQIRKIGPHLELETNINLVRLIVDSSKYPKWRSLISGAEKNKPESVNRFAVNGKYAYDLSKAYSLATGEKVPLLRLEITDANEPMLTHVEGKRFTFTGLLMPIRLPN